MRYGIKRIERFAMLTSVSVLVACASSPPPEQFGFQRVAKEGQQYFCAPPEVALRGSPWLADVSPGSHLPTQDVCLTQAEWPKWLLLHSRLTNTWWVPQDGNWGTSTP
jgi:hypothetical protein